VLVQCDPRGPPLPSNANDPEKLPVASSLYRMRLTVLMALVHESQH
jgi:hypothetical protein